MALLLALALLAACGGSPIKREPNVQLQERQQRAMAMWKARCEKSGEFIQRGVEGVRGVYLINVRMDSNYDDQYALNDPYGNDLEGVGYIGSFLQQKNGHTQELKSNDGGSGSSGYEFVEARDLKDGHLYRFTGRVVEPWQTDKSFLKGYFKFVIDKTQIEERTARYAVGFYDLSTREERDYWIAGSSLKVFDMDRNEIIGERVGYMVDGAQGSRAGGRSPWLFAPKSACPNFGHDFPDLNSTVQHVNRLQFRQASRFVQKVLKPSSP